jgi:hypothetical protein
MAMRKIVYPVLVIVFDENGEPSESTKNFFSYPEAMRYAEIFNTDDNAIAEVQTPVRY